MTVVGIARRPVDQLRTRLRTRERASMSTSGLLVLSTTLALLLGGLIMILSSSWVAAHDQYGWAIANPPGRGAGWPLRRAVCPERGGKPFGGSPIDTTGAEVLSSYPVGLL